MAAVLSRLFGAVASLLQAKPPVIVRIVEEESDPTGLRAVLLGALGLTGVLIVLMLLAGVLFAVVMFWIRSRRSEN